MAKNKIIASLELGSSKIATLISQVNIDPSTYELSLNIVGAASSESRGIRKGQIVDIEEAVESTISSVEAAERMAGYNLDSVFVSVGGAHVHSQNSHGVVAVSDPDGEVSPEDIDRVIEAASAISLPTSREIVHVVPREFIVDGEAGVKDAVGMSGVRLEVETHIITAASPALKNIRKTVNEVGAQIEGIIFSAVASAEAVLSSTEKELGCVLVDIGGGTTSLAAFVEGSIIYSSVIPIGAKNVTNDLAIGLRISLEGAEKIKVALSKEKKGKEESDEINLEEVGISEIRKISKKTLTEGIIRPRLNEIFSMVRLELERENLATRIPSGVIVTGGGAETVGVIDSARRMLSLPVRVGVPRGVGGLIDDVINPSFAGPVGLLLYGARELTQGESASFSKKIKMPNLGFAGKLIDAIKNLLP